MWHAMGAHNSSRRSQIQMKMAMTTSAERPEYGEALGVEIRTSPRGRGFGAIEMGNDLNSARGELNSRWSEEKGREEADDLNSVGIEFRKLTG